MPAHPIVHPEVSSTSSHGRLAAIVMSTALVAVVAVSGVVIALRENDAGQSSSAAAVAPAITVPASGLPGWIFPDQLPVNTDPVASSLRQVVVVSSADDIGWASSLPGMDMPGITTEYVVVNDEISQLKLHELLLSLAAPGARPTSVIDFR